MIFVNNLEKQTAVSQEEYEILLKLLAPFAPHITEELWSILGHEDSIHLQPWPEHDSSKLEKEEVTLAIQINGKVRASLVVHRGISEQEIEEKTLALPEVKKWLKDSVPKKVIIVPGKIVSIVI